jgi:hypothetical protein
MVKNSNPVYLITLSLVLFLFVITLINITNEGSITGYTTGGGDVEERYELFNEDTNRMITISLENTLDNIAETYNIHKEAILVANPNINEDTSFNEGDQLYIPPRIRVAHEGATIKTVAQHFGVTPEDILRSNPTYGPDYDVEKVLSNGIILNIPPTQMGSSAPITQERIEQIEKILYPDYLRSPDDPISSEPSPSVFTQEPGSYFTDKDGNRYLVSGDQRVYTADGANIDQLLKDGKIKHAPTRGEWASTLFNTFLRAGGGTSTVTLLQNEEKQAEVREKSREYMNQIWGGKTPSLLFDELICGRKIPKPQAGNAFVQTEDGQRIEMSAHVSGERTKVTIYNETNITIGEVSSETKYVYKLSVNMKNNFLENRTIKFNVYLGDGSNNLKTKVFNETVTLDSGRSFSLKFGDSRHPEPVSENYYDVICLHFTENPPRVGSLANLKRIDNPFCNKIQEGTKPATDYIAPSYIDMTGGTSGSGDTTSQSPNQI